MTEQKPSAERALRSATERIAHSRSPEAKHAQRLLRWRFADLIVAVRRQYLANGGKPLTNWEDLDARLRLALRTTGSMEALVERWLRDLRIPLPDSLTSSALLSFRDEVEQQRGAGWITSDRALFQLLETQRALAMAEARELVEKARAERAQGQAPQVL
jgi:hypothetical protein